MRQLARSYLQHGTRHNPRGTDPPECDVWIYVGVDPRVPFVNGSNATATAGIPDPVPLRFRLAIGPPNLCDYSGWSKLVAPVASSIVAYTKHQIEIQGDVTGVSPGDIVFVLPLEYQHAYDVPFHTHDDTGAYVPCRLYKSGEFTYGVP